MSQKTVVLIKWSLLKGGAEKQLLLLYQSLRVHGYTLKILTTKADDNLIEQHGASADLLRFRSLFDLLKTLARLKKSSSLILHSWDYKSSVYGFVFAQLLRGKFVDGSIRSAPSKSMKHYRLYKIKYRMFDLLRVKIVSNTKAGLKSYGLEKSRNTYVIYNGIQTDIVVPDIMLPDGFQYRVGMVANMRWKKDFSSLILAGKQILHNNKQVGFYLIGDGEIRSQFELLAKECDASDNFIFTGSVANPLNLINQMDVCVLCNSDSGEGFSNSIMEYMLCCKPVIATDTGGNPELVVDKTTGYLIAEKDIKSLAQLIVELLNNKARAEEMGRNGFSRLKTLFDVSTMSESYIGLYSSL